MAKEIQATLGQLVDAYPALQIISSLRYDVKTRYHFAKLLKLVTDEVRLFDETIQDLRLELGTPNDNGNVIVKAENLVEFNTKVRELRKTELNLKWGPIDLTKLPEQAENREGKMINIVPSDLASLGPLVVGELDVSS